MGRAAHRATVGVGMRGQAGVGAIEGKPGRASAMAARPLSEGSQKLNSGRPEPARTG
jgi:hypothetical protein